MGVRRVHPGRWVLMSMSIGCVWVAMPNAGRATILPLLVYDTFTEADGTPVPDHTPDVNLTGAGWVFIGGSPSLTPTPTLRGGRASSVPGPGHSQLVIDCGTPDVVLATDVRMGARALMQVIVRLTDADHYLMVQAYWGEGLRVYRREPAAWVLLAAGAIPVNAHESHHLEVRASGRAIDALWDGVPIVRAVDAVQQLATRHGLAWNTVEDRGTTFDNVSLSGNRALTTATPVATPD